MKLTYYLHLAKGQPLLPAQIILVSLPNINAEELAKCKSPNGDAWTACCRGKRVQRGRTHTRSFP